MKQNVRIIGGQYRGKKISFPDLEGLRPTPNRVKETLFNWLMNDIRDARCLDAFAGSGGLGFEAYSRGAKRVVLVEAVDKAYKHLQQTAASFNSGNLLVVHAKALDYFKKTKEMFDIIFLDPPFANNEYTACLEVLAHTSVLIKGGLVYLESAQKQCVNPEHWQEKKAKQAGQVFYGLYEKISNSPDCG